MNTRPTDAKDANKTVAVVAANPLPRTIDSQDLLGVQGLLYIRHQNEIYRLQTTRFGKLILTK